MCGWPPARKRRVGVWHDQVACGHVSGLLTRSSHDHWPQWVPRTGASSDPRDSVPRLLRASPGPSAQPITPSRFLPSQASLTGKLGLCRNCLPIALPPGHHRPNDAGRLVRESNGDQRRGRLARSLNALEVAHGHRLAEVVALHSSQPSRLRRAARPSRRLRRRSACRGCARPPRARSHRRAARSISSVH